jgi:hypothetical protein
MSLLFIVSYVRQNKDIKKSDFNCYGLLIHTILLLINLSTLSLSRSKLKGKAIEKGVCI